ncbi:hypothetical protein [Ottowia sp. VDI28]
MTCNAEETRWLMEWAVFLLIILAFGIAGAYRWAKSAPKEIPNDQ